MKRAAVSAILIVLFLPAGFGRAASPAFELERIGPFGGDVRSLLVDARNPDVVYLGTPDGKIYKSTSGGASWRLLHPGIARRNFVVDTLVSHPAEPEHIYAGAWDLRSTGGGLFESRDGGATWTELRLAARAPAVRDLAISRSNPACMIAAALDGVYVTSDGGSQWRKVGAESPGLREVESVAIDPGDPRILYAGTWRLVYRSRDFGATWARVSQGMFFDSDIFSLSIDPRNPEVVFASACSGVYRSANRAVSWKRLRLVADRFTVRARVVAVDPVDSRRVYTGTTEGLFRTVDDGESWKRLTAPSVTVNAVQIDPRNHDRILVGTDGSGVLASDDGGRTWRESNAGFVQRQISRIIVDPAAAGRFFAGILSHGRAGGFFLFDAARASWAPETAALVSRVPDALSFLPLPAHGGKLAGTVQGLYWQQPGSAEWVKASGEIGRLAVGDLAFDAASGSVFAATGAGIYRGSLPRLDLVKVSPWSPRILSLAVGSGPRPAVYAGSSMGILRSADLGTTWTVLTSALQGPHAAEALALCPAEPDHMLAGTVIGLFESSDGGATWHRARDGRLAVDVPSVLFLDRAGARILAADNTFGGVFVSEDGGLSWEKLDREGYGSPVRCAVQDPAAPDVVYLGTNSDGLYRLRLPARGRGAAGPANP